MSAEEHPKVYVDLFRAMDRELEEVEWTKESEQKRIRREALDGRCGRHVEVELISIDMYGDVSRTPVGGKTYRKTTIKVPVCAECRTKITTKRRRRACVCGIVFFIIVGLGVLGGILRDGPSAPIIGGGVLLGFLAAVGVYQIRSNVDAVEDVLSNYLPIAELLRQGWFFGSSPSKW